MSMQCEQAETRLAELASGEPTAGDAALADAAAHVESCDRCREKLADYRLTLKLLADGFAAEAEETGVVPTLSADRRASLEARFSAPPELVRSGDEVDDPARSGRFNIRNYLRPLGVAASFGLVAIGAWGMMNTIQGKPALGPVATFYESEASPPAPRTATPVDAVIDSTGGTLVTPNEYPSDDLAKDVIENRSTGAILRSQGRGNQSAPSGETNDVAGNVTKWHAFNGTDEGGAIAGDALDRSYEREESLAENLRRQRSGDDPARALAGERERVRNLEAQKATLLARLNDKDAQIQQQQAEIVRQSALNAGYETNVARLSTSLDQYSKINDMLEAEVVERREKQLDAEKKLIETHAALRNSKVDQNALKDALLHLSDGLAHADGEGFDDDADGNGNGNGLGDASGFGARGQFLGTGGGGGGADYWSRTKGSKIAGDSENGDGQSSAEYAFGATAAEELTVDGKKRPELANELGRDGTIAKGKSDPSVHWSIDDTRRSGRGPSGLDRLQESLQQGGQGQRDQNAPAPGGDFAGRWADEKTEEAEAGGEVARGERADKVIAGAFDRPGNAQPGWEGTKADTERATAAREAPASEAAPDDDPTDTPDSPAVALGGASGPLPPAPTKPARPAPPTATPSPKPAPVAPTEPGPLPDAPDVGLVPPTTPADPAAAETPTTRGVAKAPGQKRRDWAELPEQEPAAPRDLAEGLAPGQPVTGGTPGSGAIAGKPSASDSRYANARPSDEADQSDELDGRGRHKETGKRKSEATAEGREVAMLERDRELGKMLKDADEYRNRGDHRKALELVDESLSLDPDNAKARELRQTLVRGTLEDLDKTRAFKSNKNQTVTLDAEQEKAQSEILPAASNFKQVPVNPFVLTARDRFSTFGIDTDSASYALARKYVRAGFRPPAGAIRMEEFVNAFDYNYANQADRVFTVHAEAGEAPYGDNLTLLKVGVKARTIGRENRKPAHLVFVIDASGSMDRPDRLPLVKHSLGLLVKQLGPEDRVSIVAYGTKPILAAEAAPASNGKPLIDAINRIQAGGSTNMIQALSTGYNVARNHFKPGEINRVILCSDGVANVGSTDAEQMLVKVASNRAQGITLTNVGFGIGGYNDALMTDLAKKGDGNYVFVDTTAEAKRLFVDQLASTLQTVAKDAKIQVEFDPERVRRYRLIGYERRDIADKDFRNDTIDAGEVGSGQSATALYEVELVPAPGDNAVELADLGTVFVRYQNVETGEVEEISSRLRSSLIRERTPQRDPRFYLAASAAEFAELLRGSDFAQSGSLEAIERRLVPVVQQLPLDRQASELLDLVRRTKGLPAAP